MKLLAILPALTLAQNVEFNNFCKDKARFSKHVDIFKPGCKTYLRCLFRSKPRRLPCPGGTVYNAATQKCDYELNVPECAPTGSFEVF